MTLMLRRSFLKPRAAQYCGIRCCYLSTVDEPLQVPTRQFSIAPMMEITNEFQRYFQRLITKKAVLYTEMVTSNALIRGKDSVRFLTADFAAEEPLVLQLGGNDPLQMSQAMKMAVEYGYKEVNINCGCPSSKVAGAGCFGAALMLEKRVVSDMVQAMAAVSGGVPITIKCRIGVDDHDSYEQLAEFIELLSTQAGVRHFVIHARKAILNMKLTPADNRKIPPLSYETVYRLVKDFPHLDFTLNGGVASYEEARQHYEKGVKGVMVGRAAVEDCYYWRKVDSEFYGTVDPGLTRRQILEQYGAFCDQQEKTSKYRISRSVLLKPVHNLFHKTGANKEFKRQLEVFGRKEESVSKAFQFATRTLSEGVLDSY